MYALNAMKGTAAWSHPVPDVLTFTVVDGTSYIVTMGNRLEALQPSGMVAWQLQLPSAAIQPLIVSDGAIYTGTASGTVYALRASDSALLWRYATQKLPGS